MKYIKQFAMIIAVSLIGEVLHALFPLPIPASIYGLVLMLAALVTGIVPHGSVSETGHFLVDIMPLMFIPAGVGLMVSFDVLKPLLLPYLTITVVSTLLVMLAAGRVTQAVMRRSRKGEEAHHG